MQEKEHQQDVEMGSNVSGLVGCCDENSKRLRLKLFLGGDDEEWDNGDINPFDVNFGKYLLIVVYSAKDFEDEDYGPLCAKLIM